MWPDTASPVAGSEFGPESLLGHNQKGHRSTVTVTNSARKHVVLVPLGTSGGETTAHGVHSNHRKQSTYQCHLNPHPLFSGSYARVVGLFASSGLTRVSPIGLFPIFGTLLRRGSDCGLYVLLGCPERQSTTRSANKQAHECMVPQRALLPRMTFVGATQTREFSSSSSRCCSVDIKCDTCPSLLFSPYSFIPIPLRHNHETIHHCPHRRFFESDSCCSPGSRG